MDIKAVGATQNFYGIYNGPTTTSGTSQISQFNGSGFAVTGIMSSGVSGHTCSIGSFIHNGNIGSAFKGDVAFKASINSYAGLSGNENGLVQATGSGLTELYCNSAIQSGWLGFIGSSTQLSIAIGGGKLSTTGFNITAGGVVRLAGDFKATGLGLDYTKLDGTIGNHAFGATFYNTNATVLGNFIGTGVYTRGTSAWTRIAV